MKLTEYLKEFQVVSARNHFSANARSLYLALLLEFDRAFYPEQLFLLNGYLQEISGITATSSLDSARTKLVSCKLITHKKNYYGLLLGEASAKLAERENKLKNRRLGKAVEIPGFIPYTLTNLPQPQTPKPTAAAPRPCASEALPSDGTGFQTFPPLKKLEDCPASGNVGESEKNFVEGLPSAEVMAAWKRGNGVVLNLYQLQQLGVMEVEVGTDELVRQIESASLKDNRAGLTFAFFNVVRKGQESAGKYDGEDFA